MRYQGGKTRLAPSIAEVIRNHVGGGPRRWWDPFCGGLSVAYALLEEFGPGTASDFNEALISLYSAVADGWEPPLDVSEIEYKAAKKLAASDPLRAFCAIGCSYGAKWFGGFARSEGRNHAAEAGRSLLREASAIRQLSPKYEDFMSVTPCDDFDFVYCDPPYANTTGYGATGAFDTAAFQARVLEWSRFCRVFVSEFEFPYGRVIWEKTRKVTMHAKPLTARERLYLVE